MSQATLDDDELFGEAATEIQDDVESSVTAAWEELPAVEALWETNATNTLGALNGLNSALETTAATEHLRDAKKWFVIGQRADAIGETDELAAEIETLETTIEALDSAHEEVESLTRSLPELKQTLEAERETE